MSLGTSFRGQLIRPEDGSYEEHRKIWNGSIDRRPALIARCAGAADVIAALRLAKRGDLQVAVRSGGHSTWPIDLRRRPRDRPQPDAGIRVDPEAGTARTQAGTLWGDFDLRDPGIRTRDNGRDRHAHRGGRTPLGGGIGWLQRKHGLTIDQLIGVDLITAEGELVKASAAENADLFWGVRGGGGNFGIVTEFEFRLHPVGPTVLAGPIFWPMVESPAFSVSTASGSRTRRTS